MSSSPIPEMVLLARTPGVLRALLAELPDEWVRSDEGPDTWSAFDVVGHLIDGEETDWIARARIVMEQGETRRFAPFDRFRHLRTNQQRTLGELLDRFEQLRAHNLRELEGFGIGSEHLDLQAEHPALGTVTLAQLLSTWVAHDLNHLGQIARVLAHRLRDDVGPWKAYLRILHPRGE